MSKGIIVLLLLLPMLAGCTQWGRVSPLWQPRQIPPHLEGSDIWEQAQEEKMEQLTNDQQAVLKIALETYEHTSTGTDKSIAFRLSVACLAGEFWFQPYSPGFSLETLQIERKTL
jgi:hypothetical protein